MVLEESETLEPWLANEHRFVEVARGVGFGLERRRMRPLHALMRFSVLADPPGSVASG